MFNHNLLPFSQHLTLNPLRAVTLVRVSTAQQAEDGRSGIDRQRAENARVVRDKGYLVIHEIELVDVSGTSSHQSPELQELIRMAERRELDVVVVSEMSRLIRPDLASFSFLEEFRRNSVIIDCGGNVHDFNNSSGFLSGSLQALIGGHERMVMLNRMIQSKEAARAAGRCPSADITLPLGLAYDRKIDRFRYTDDVQRVQEAFRLIDLGGLRNMSEVGRRTGIQPPTLRNLLRNKSYIGIREYTSVRDGSVKLLKANARQGDRPKIARKPEHIIRVRIFEPEEQAVSDECFARVQHALGQMRNHHARIQAGRAKGGNLLAGVGRCGSCGGCRPAR
jgi:DNA invertase Pin-like site-specific DNA recombinase